MAHSTSFPNKRCLQASCNVRRFVGAQVGVLGVLLLLAVLVTPASSVPQLITYRPVDGKGTKDGKFTIPCE